MMSAPHLHWQWCPAGPGPSLPREPIPESWDQSQYLLGKMIEKVVF